MRPLNLLAGSAKLTIFSQLELETGGVYYSLDWTLDRKKYEVGGSNGCVNYGKREKGNKRMMVTDSGKLQEPGHSISSKYQRKR